MQKTFGPSRGFTPIDLAVVLGIVGFLAVAVLVAIDPVKRVQDTRDARRYSEVNAILHAILAKQEHDGASYEGAASAPVITQASTNVQVLVTSDAGIVCNAAASRPGCNKAMDTLAANKNCVVNVSDATALPLIPQYIDSLPIDPKGTGSPCTDATTPCATRGDLDFGPTNSGYYIARTLGGRVEIGSCSPEQQTNISVKR